MNEEDKMLLENFIKSNPFDFKQGIINQCRQMEKADVYEWVAEDELKIQKLHQEKQKLERNWNELKKYIKDYPSIRYSSIEKVDGIYLSGKLIREDNLLDKMQELEEGGNNDC